MNVAVAEYANDVPVGQSSITVDTGAGQSATITADGVTVNVAAADTAVAVSQIGDTRLAGHDLTVTVAQGLQGPAGPTGGIDEFDTDQYGRIILDGGLPTLTNGA